jgi:hypothetical protein
MDPSTAVALLGEVTAYGRMTRCHFEYGTTTDYGSRTSSVDAGAGILPVQVAGFIGALAPNTTYHYRLVATNGDGTSVGADQSFTTAAARDPGPVADTTAPVISAASAERVKRTTKFRFTLSEPARVVFTIQRTLAGRKVGNKCVKPRRANRRKPKCSRFKAVGRFSGAAKGGANVKTFNWKIGRKKLKPGRYRATLVATDAAGNRSKPKRLRFRVVRR